MMEGIEIPPLYMIAPTPHRVSYGAHAWLAATFVLWAISTSAWCGLDAPTSADPNLALDGTRWLLLHAQSSAHEPQFGLRVILQFNANHLSLRTGCGTTTAAYEIHAGVLQVGELTRAVHPCAEDHKRFDRALLTALSARPIVKRSSNELFLETNDARLRFAAEPGPSAKAAAETIEVAARRKACMGMVPTMCLQTRTAGTQLWQVFYGMMLDFDPQPGIQYQLRVLEEPVANPPADAPSTYTFVDALLSERRVKGH